MYLTFHQLRCQLITRCTNHTVEMPFSFKNVHLLSCLRLYSRKDFGWSKCSTTVECSCFLPNRKTDCSKQPSSWSTESERSLKRTKKAYFKIAISVQWFLPMLVSVNNIQAKVRLTMQQVFTSSLPVMIGLDFRACNEVITCHYLSLKQIYKYTN